MKSFGVRRGNGSKNKKKKAPLALISKKKNQY